VASESGIGVLALQGDYAAHAAMLAACGAHVAEVRKPEQLAGLRGLVLPGGESTTLLKLMEGTQFMAALKDFARRGGALFGTCAGMILLAGDVTSPAQQSLSIMDIDVARNAYGRQLDSFEGEAEWVGAEPALAGSPLPLVFIRAPKITRLGAGVEPLARCRGDVVMARQGRVLVTSFHPEMSDDLRIHRLFITLAGISIPSDRRNVACPAS
jgi:5'-phosphate synthase pdxT subunit